MTDAQEKNRELAGSLLVIALGAGTQLFWIPVIAKLCGSQLDLGWMLTASQWSAYGFFALIIGHIIWAAQSPRRSNLL